MIQTTKTAPGAAAAARAGASAYDPASLLAVVFCVLFFLEGLTFIPYIGLQNDEALFGAAIFPPLKIERAIRISGHQLPTMLESYLGTLKAWIYEPLFGLLGPSVWSVRLPVLLAGALTVWLFFLFVRYIAGTRAALAATALLASDASFVLTTCLDWGPIALQHLLLLAGLAMLWRFHDCGDEAFLAGGFLAFGFALWDKSLFSWVLVGLAAAAAVACRRRVSSQLTAVNLAIAALALVTGAAPLVAYNGAGHFGTLRSSTRLSAPQLRQEAAVLLRTIEGSALFGTVVRNEPALDSGKPENGIEALSIGATELSRGLHKSFFPLALILAFALLPWIWATPARKPMLFALVFCAVVWLQMAFSLGAGGTSRAVLPYPFPHLFVGVALAQASRTLRRAGPVLLTAVLVPICGSNLVVLNQHLAQLVERGTTVAWTDAIDPLSAYLNSAGARHVYIADQGIVNSLRLLSGGRLALEMLPDPRGSDPAVVENALKMLAVPGAIVVGHTEGNEMLPGVNAGLDALAESAGYRRQLVKTIADRNGRPIFEVCRYPRAGA
jgi:Dolichyl-phosphate-mannose-protein mannosyltransferase